MAETYTVFIFTSHKLIINDLAILRIVLIICISYLTNE